MDNELLWVAGFIVFLCIFRWRGLLICGAVLGVLYAVALHEAYQANLAREQAETRVRDSQVECATYTSTDERDVDRFLGICR